MRSAQGQHLTNEEAPMDGSLQYLDVWWIRFEQFSGAQVTKQAQQYASTCCSLGLPFGWQAAPLRPLRESTLHAYCLQPSSVRRHNKTRRTMSKPKPLFDDAEVQPAALRVNKDFAKRFEVLGCVSVVLR
jgi:hypothetical protein